MDRAGSAASLTFSVSATALPADVADRTSEIVLAEGRSDPSKSFQYFLWRQMVEYLLEARGLAFDELAAMGHEADRVEIETRSALRDGSI